MCCPFIHIYYKKRDDSQDRTSRSAMFLNRQGPGADILGKLTLPHLKSILQNGGNTIRQLTIPPQNKCCCAIKNISHSFKGEIIDNG